MTLDGSTPRGVARHSLEMEDISRWDCSHSSAEFKCVITRGENCEKGVVREEYQRGQVAFSAGH